ncbi:hypothetical protein C1H46_036344 [Malus baccata]|uniref:Uncharacterized protein n=1 Tax=Malus baccata TaxID=106549 RepID=A0A540KV63_MALBA|nr:hypothetical protein C1H46_036344 [Malus baccata]
MAEATSPKPPAAPRNTESTSNRPHSPISPLFVLGSNDDQLERAQARAAGIRRKAATVAAHSSPPDDCLTREQIIKLFQECIKLARESVHNAVIGIEWLGKFYIGSRVENLLESTLEDDHVSNKQGREKESERKWNPPSKLLKKFDVTLVADPLYHQTSAQLNEGGAKGLLLNNLGVYGGRQVLFDAYEVPGKCRSCSLHSNALELIDLSFAKGE